MSRVPLHLQRARAGVAWCFFLNGFVFASWVGHIPAVKAAHGLDDAQLGLLLVCLSAGAVVTLPVAGWLVARLGSRGVTATAALGLCVTLPVPVLSPMLAGTVAGLLAFGACNAMIDVAMNAQAVEVERGFARPILSGMHGLFSLGGLAGALVASASMYAGAGDAEHLLAVSAIGVLGTFGIRGWLLRSAEARGAGPVFARPRGVLLTLGAFAFIALLTEGAVADWSAVYLRDALGASPGTAALGFGAFSLTMAGGRFLGDGLAARLGRQRLLRGSGMVAAAGIVLAAAASDPAVALVGFALAGCGLANLIPLLFAAAGNVPGMPAGVGLAAVATTGYCGYLAGPPAVGFVAERVGLGAGLMLLAAGCVVVGLAAVGRRIAVSVVRSR